EMGIANTSPSSIWMSLFCHIPLNQCIGAGAGLNNAGINHKKKVLNEALAHFVKLKMNPATEDIIRCFGGFEMVA
ncbi:nicotinate-nucleotide--dimethylbenzimidazole phosphoribosyltransferase, partial [Klebsiella pneumoniae]|uniref:nicotinate-nucleotide--dimethylbenzimidazole phosphoribosyltransferase n=1 Tax=Klebsiella pneumoniae TaxID=573 RepID=UPI003A837B7B